MFLPTAKPSPMNAAMPTPSVWPSFSILIWSSFVPSWKIYPLWLEPMPKAPGAILTMLGATPYRMWHQLHGASKHTLWCSGGCVGKMGSWSLSSSGVDKALAMEPILQQLASLQRRRPRNAMTWFCFWTMTHPPRRSWSIWPERQGWSNSCFFFPDNEINMTTKVKFSAGVAQPLSAAAGTQWDKAGQGRCPQAVCRVKHRDRLDTRTAATCGR